MFLRWVTAAYLVYLVAPIALLLVASFGELWLNTLLPTGWTTHWYVDVARDPSFRRAFAASLAVVAITCTACVAIGLPLAYALFHTESRRLRALVRVLYQLPVALPPLVLAFGFILVFSSDTLPWLSSILLVVGRPGRALAAVLPASGGGRHAASGPARSRGRCGVAGQQRLAALHAHRAAGAASFGPRRPDHRRGAVDRRIPVLESGRGLPQSHLSGGAAAGLLRRDRIRLRGDGDPACIGDGRWR